MNGFGVRATGLGATRPSRGRLGHRFSVSAQVIVGVHFPECSSGNGPGGNAYLRGLDGVRGWV